MHAFVFRNWTLVPIERLATVLETSKANVARLGKSMGLANPPRVSSDQLSRSYITIIKRNWHLLPEEQLLTLLEWSREKLAFTLREDDFLYIKLGSFKPDCPRLKYTTPTEAENKRAAQIASWLKDELPKPKQTEPATGRRQRRLAPRRPFEARAVSLGPRVESAPLGAPRKLAAAGRSRA
jgi:hypothetical protein